MQIIFGALGCDVKQVRFPRTPTCGSIQTQDRAIGVVRVAEPVPKTGAHDGPREGQLGNDRLSVQLSRLGRLRKLMPSIAIARAFQILGSCGHPSPVPSCKGGLVEATCCKDCSDSAGGPSGVQWVHPLYDSAMLSAGRCWDYWPSPPCYSCASG
jgi:hypothetical protein